MRIGFMGLGNMGGPTLIPAARGTATSAWKLKPSSRARAPPRGDRQGRASEGLQGEREGLSKDQFLSLEVVRIDGIEELPDVFTGFDVSQTPRMFYSSLSAMRRSRHRGRTCLKGENTPSVLHP
jgi:hypothetical protein